MGGSQKTKCNGTAGWGRSELSTATGDASRTVKRWAQYPRWAVRPKRNAEDKGLKQNVTWSPTTQPIWKDILNREPSGLHLTGRGFLSFPQIPLSSAGCRKCWPDTRTLTRLLHAEGEGGLAKHRLSTQAPAGSEAGFTREALIKKKTTTEPNCLTCPYPAGVWAGSTRAEKLRVGHGEGENVSLDRSDLMVTAAQG